MVIGRGLLGQALKKIDNKRYLFYANGVSNSVVSEIPENNYEYTEIKKLAENSGDKVFIYISTIQLNAKENFNRAYVKHKSQIEFLIKDIFAKYLIVRTSNIIGYNLWNRHTLFNYLYNSLQSGTAIQVDESVKRNVLDADHFIDLFGYYLNCVHFQNSVIDIVNPESFPMEQILQAFENAFKISFLKEPFKTSIAHFEASNELSLFLIEKCNINLDNYLNYLINKYYLSPA